MSWQSFPAKTPLAESHTLTFIAMLTCALYSWSLQCIEHLAIAPRHCIQNRSYKSRDCTLL